MRDIAEIPPGHTLALGRLLESGVVGWHRQSSSDFLLYALKVTVAKFAGSKEKVLGYDDLFPVHALIKRKGKSAFEVQAQAFLERAKNASRD